MDRGTKKNLMKSKIDQMPYYTCSNSRIVSFNLRVVLQNSVVLKNLSVQIEIVALSSVVLISL